MRSTASRRSCCRQFIAFQTLQRSPTAALDDNGFGVYGRGTFLFGSRFEGTIGLRADSREQGARLLETFVQPAIAPPVVVDQEESFTDVSPQFTAAYHVSPAQMIYATAARGFKAGGFNAASPPGSEGLRRRAQLELRGGHQDAAGFEPRVAERARCSSSTGTTCRSTCRTPPCPAQFFIDNAGAASSKGVELELNARVLPGCDFFAGLGYTNARFSDGSISGGLDVTDHKLPNTPDYTANVGGQYTQAFSDAISGYVRAEIVFRGDYFYDDSNTEGQDAYSLTNFRVRRARQAAVRRGLAPQRVRHHLHPDRVRLPRPRAVRVPGRDGRAADVRGQGRGHFLEPATTVELFPLGGEGPDPRRVLTLMPRLGFACPRLGMAAGAAVKS